MGSTSGNLVFMLNALIRFDVNGLTARFVPLLESTRPMWGVNPSLGCSNSLPPIDSNPSPRTRREEHVLPIVRMSSGRLFLDRVARQHRPSPLHRRLTCTPQIQTPGQQGTFLLCSNRAKQTIVLVVAQAYNHTGCDDGRLRPQPAFAKEGKTKSPVVVESSAVVHNPARKSGIKTAACNFSP